MLPFSRPVVPFSASFFLFEILSVLKAQFQGQQLQEALPGESCSLHTLASPHCCRSHRIRESHHGVCEELRPPLLKRHGRVVMGPTRGSGMRPCGTLSAAVRPSGETPGPVTVPAPIPTLAREYIWVFISPERRALPVCGLQA